MESKFIDFVVTPVTPRKHRLFSLRRLTAAVVELNATLAGNWHMSSLQLSLYRKHGLKAMSKEKVLRVTTSHPAPGFPYVICTSKIETDLHCDTVDALDGKGRAEKSIVHLEWETFNTQWHGMEEMGAKLMMVQIPIDVLIKAFDCCNTK
ncbi:hypothetical protein HDU98_004159 [Podochytrium sp. JEL0797]|nr:hypothetical protein HDU98_004159 [Podochytrium sp. JEL0797]